MADRHLALQKKNKRKLGSKWNSWLRINSPKKFGHCSMRFDSTRNNSNLAQEIWTGPIVVIVLATFNNQSDQRWIAWFAIDHSTPTLLCDSIVGGHHLNDKGNTNVGAWWMMAWLVSISDTGGVTPCTNMSSSLLWLYYVSSGLISGPTAIIKSIALRFMHRYAAQIVPFTQVHISTVT